MSNLKERYEKNAWDMLQSYLQLVEQELIEAGIDHKEAKKLVTDIANHFFYRCDDFFEKNGIVTFMNVNTVITELGSPAEIAKATLENVESNLLPREKDFVKKDREYSDEEVELLVEETKSPQKIKTEYQDSVDFRADYYQKRKDIRENNDSIVKKDLSSESEIVLVFCSLILKFILVIFLVTFILSDTNLGLDYYQDYQDYVFSQIFGISLFILGFLIIDILISRQIIQYKATNYRLEFPFNPQFHSLFYRSYLLCSLAFILNPAIRIIVYNPSMMVSTVFIIIVIATIIEHTLHPSRDNYFKLMNKNKTFRSKLLFFRPLVLWFILITFMYSLLIGIEFEEYSVNSLSIYVPFWITIFLALIMLFYNPKIERKYEVYPFLIWSTRTLLISIALPVVWINYGFYFWESLLFYLILEIATEIWSIKVCGYKTGLLGMITILKPNSVQFGDNFIKKIDYLFAHQFLDNISVKYFLDRISHAILLTVFFCFNAIFWSINGTIPIYLANDWIYYDFYNRINLDYIMTLLIWVIIIGSFIGIRKLVYTKERKHYFKNNGFYLFCMIELTFIMLILSNYVWYENRYATILRFFPLPIILSNSLAPSLIIMAIYCSLFIIKIIESRISIEPVKNSL